jgi:hypothetical protein
MSEPDEMLDPITPDQVTPSEETATPDDKAQPEEPAKEEVAEESEVEETKEEEVVEEVVEEAVPAAKVWEEKVKDLEAKAKRYKEQLHGKDKLIESLRVKKLAATLQPQASEPEEVDDDEYERPVEKPRAEDFQTKLLIENTLTTNEFKMGQRYSGDEYLPWTEETKEEVYKELFKLDPSGKSLLRFDAVELAYKNLKGQKTEAIVRSATQKAIEEKDKEIARLKAKESRKTVEAVETSTPSSEENIVPPIEDIVSGKVKLSASEMVKYYPEYFGNTTRKLLGLD